MNSFLNIQVRIVAQQAQAALRQLDQQMNSLGSGGFNTGRLDRMGSQMQWLGRQIEYNFTVPLAMAGTAATKFALDNEAAFVRIQKVYGDAGHGAEFYAKELDSLKRAFVALSNQFGVAQADALNIAADWAAAGASGLALAQSVELTMKTMILGELGATTATQSLIAIQAQYGLSVKQLAETVDILNMVENQTGISMAGLIDGFSRSAGVARAAGVDVRHLAADLAALTPATGSAANAGNALKTIFSRLFDTTKQATEVLGLMGINTKDFAWQSANAQDKLITMAKSFEGLSSANQNFVSSIIASRYQVNRFDVLMKELVSSTGYYARALQSTTDMNAVYKQSVQELNMVLTSSPQRLKIMWTMLQNSVADIIQPMIPVILWFTSAIMKLMQAFSDLSPSIQKFILFSLVAVAAMGPLIRYLGAIQVLVFEVGRLFKLLLIPLEAIGSVFKWLWAGVSIAGTVLGFLASSTLPALKIAFQSSLFVIEVFIGAIERLSFISTLVGMTLGPIWRTALLGLQRVIAVSGPALQGLWFAVMLSIQAITVAFGSGLPATWSAIMLSLRTVTAAFGYSISLLWAALAASIESITLALGSAITILWSSIMLSIQRITTALGAGISALWSALMVSISSITVAFGSGLPAVWSAVLLSFQRMTAVWGFAISNLWSAIMVSIQSVTTAWGTVIPNLWAAVLLTVQRITTVWGTIIPVLWSAIMLGIQRVTYVYGFGIPAIWSAIMLGVQRVIAIAAPGITGIWTLTLLSIQRFIAVAGTAWQIAWYQAMSAIRLATMVGGISIQYAWAGVLFAIRTMTFSWSVVMTALWGGLALAINGIWSAAFNALRTITFAGAAAITRTVQAFGFGINFIMQGIGGAVAVIWSAMWRSLAQLTTVGWMMITRLWTVGMMGLTFLTTGFIPAMRAIGTAITVAFSGPWGWAIAAVLLIIGVFWKQIIQIWQNGVNFFRNGAGIADAFGPLGRAAVAVRDVVMRAFNSLPAGIRSAMIAVVDTIASAAKAVYQWFSYINPFAKHSPSLVDNVKGGSEAIQDHFATTNNHADNHRQVMAATTAAGASGASDHANATQGAMDQVRAQYQALTGVASVFGKAGDDLQKFADKVAYVQQELDRIQYAKLRKDLAAIAADAIPEFDRLVADLYPLESQLAKISSEMTAQQGIVEGWKNKLDDANATLKIQQDALDGMKLGIDQFTQKVQVLNGGIELLSGIRTQLRQAGAGSDILKSYDDQIKALQGQKQGINDQLKAAQTAYIAQENLVLSLTRARDKLQESYDLENRKLEVIKDAYDQIAKRIQAIKTAISDFSNAANQLKGPAAAAGGAGSGTAANFAAGQGANFPDVGGSGALGREGGIADQSALIDQFTKDIQNKTKDLFGKFDFLEPIRKAWNKAWEWVKSTFGPIGGWIGDFFSNLFKDVHMPNLGLGGFADTFKDMFKSIQDVFDGLWKMIGPPIKEIGKIIWDSLGKAFKEIWPEIVKFKELLGPIGDLFKELWTVIKPVAAFIGGVLLLAISILVNVFKEALGPILNWIISIIKDVIKVIRGIVEIIVGVFTGDIDLALKGFKDLFQGVWDAVIQTLKDAGLLIWGIVKGIFEGVWNFAKWLYDVLIGHSIIPDIVNGVMEWFQKMHDALVAIWNALVDALKWVWDNVLWPVFRAIGDAFKVVGDVISEVVAWIGRRWDDMVAGLHIMWGWVKSIIQWVKDKFWEIVDAVSNVVNNIHGWIDNFINKVISIKDRIGNTLYGIWNGLKEGFKDAINWIIGKWNGLSFDAGPLHLSVPKMDYLASGGLVANQAMAIVGEGRKGFPEYVIPTDPMYRDRALGLFESLGKQLGIDPVASGAGVLRLLTQQIVRGVMGDRVQFLASGGTIGRASVQAGSQGGGTVVLAPSSDNKEYHFHGDLSFPNIKSGSDAKEFVKNLKALINS